MARYAPDPAQRVTVFLGEAGCGKSELAVQWALTAAERGRDVHFFDLDQTKPLLRSRDAAALLEGAGVTVHFEQQCVTPMVPPGGAGIGMHVIPVEKAIEMENESVDLEHISHWLNKYEGKYAASPCSCRRSRLTHGEGCADDPEGWCIAVGDMVRKFIISFISTLPLFMSPEDTREYPNSIRYAFLPVKRKIYLSSCCSLCSN